MATGNKIIMWLKDEIWSQSKMDVCPIQSVPSSSEGDAKKSPYLDKGR